MMEQKPIEGWKVIDGGQMPEDYLSVIRREQPDVLMLVDAADMGLEPGAIRSLDEEDVATECLMTTHSLPITILLKSLHECCGNVVFVGVQPAQTEFFGALTPEVQAAVEKIYGFLAQGAHAFEDIPSVEEESDEGAPDADAQDNGLR